MMRALLVVLLMLVALTSSACELIGNIFQAGMWTGVILVVLIVVVIGFLVGKMRR
jgi:hypothetical protein